MLHLNFAAESRWLKYLLKAHRDRTVNHASAVVELAASQLYVGVQLARAFDRVDAVAC